MGSRWVGEEDLWWEGLLKKVCLEFRVEESVCDGAGGPRWVEWDESEGELLLCRFIIIIIENGQDAQYLTYCETIIREACPKEAAENGELLEWVSEWVS